MEAVAPKTASVTWRAILAGREALNAGLIKRVGSRETISIWNDDWIPRPFSKRPMGRQFETNINTVDELMTVSRQWNVPLIRSLFFAPDAEEILKIPLRNSGGEDWLAWFEERSGIYSVKSA